MDQRLFARIGPLPFQQTVHRRVDRDGQVTLMPNPAVVLLEPGPQSAMVYRYTASGAFGGDSWAEDVAAAKRMVALEYGSALHPWQPIPDAADDAVAYALSQRD
jgi:hypothetical protein